MQREATRGHNSSTKDTQTTDRLRQTDRQTDKSRQDRGTDTFDLLDKICQSFSPPSSPKYKCNDCCYQQDQPSTTKYKQWTRYVVIKIMTS